MSAFRWLAMAAWPRPASICSERRPRLVLGLGGRGLRLVAALLIGCRSLRGLLGQLFRLVRLGVEECDDVGAILAARQASEGHGGARHHTSRIGQILVEVIRRPVALLALHRRGVVEARLGMLRPADDVPEVGADPVGLALAEGVAGGAFLGLIFAAAEIGAGETHRQGHLRRRLFSRRASGGLFLGRDLVARLLRIVRREQRAGCDIERQQDQTGAEDGAENLVQFEGIHRWSALAGGTARAFAARTLRRRTNTRFSWALATRITRLPWPTKCSS